MSEDDLDRPIGKRASPKKGKLAARFDPASVAAFVVGGVLVFAGFWALLVNDPLGGEPVAVATIVRKAGVAPAAQQQAENKSPDAHDPHEPAVNREGTPVINPGDPLPKKGPVIIRIPGEGEPPAGSASAAAGPRPPDPALLESSAYGSLPRVGADGRRPLDVYARGADAAPGAARVALVVAGLGVGREITNLAIQSLPATVSLAFSPYGDDVADLVEKARASGHEVLLQAPMEPFGYPANDTGPQTLLTALPASANLERLRWALGRAKGYVGVAPLGGGKFLDADASVQPVFTELARRGLLFASASDDGDSRLGQSASRVGLAHTKAGATIDGGGDAASIDAALADLERSAKQGEVSLGFATATPLTLKRIDVWREGLAKRGVALVPASAAIAPQGPS
ncbi:divergent polysaccharide deacetylase family protein [Hansschlegelia quercus]|uniref:Divergent polysaccharide deacetylase family protein n=1 Tax=Hansschlegelia quercus TaxID=2528245 RepID=A0A4Q9GPD6_9HYPH|nr:divergent polysaccharide deacetylase family protein [Hansschlegelia quercus]TBN53447.1 divergent polysaccharide deacetylase family protein [Hansschlegelia quercus]